MKESLFAKRFFRYFGYFLSIICIFILSKVFLENYDRLTKFSFNFNFYIIFTFSILASLLGHFFLSLTWFIQLKHKYPNFSLIKSFSVIGVSQIAKYLPGNFAHLVGRGVLVRKEISQKDVLATLFLESLVLAMSAALCGWLWLNSYALTDEVRGVLSYSALAIFFVFATVFIETMRRRYSNLIFRYQTIILLLFINSTAFILHGFVIFLMAKYIAGLDSLTLFQCIVGFALSFLVGYILPGAPGGIGVREYAFVLLFSPFVPEVVALQIIICYRLVSIVGDLAFFALAYAIRQK